MHLRVICIWLTKLNLNLKLKLSLYVLVFCSNKQKNFYLIKVFFPLHLPRTLNPFFILVSNKVEVFQNRQNSRTNTKIKKKKKCRCCLIICLSITEFNCSILLNEKTISIVKSMKVTSLMCYLFFYFFCLLFLNQAVYEHAHTHHNGLLKITVTN